MKNAIAKAVSFLHQLAEEERWSQDRVKERLKEI
jgi:hypothetical protein